MPHEPIYFPEPTSPDESLLGWDETAVDWLRRSTTPQANAVREFLNRSLAHFPPKHAKSLAKRLNQDWQSHWFEIVVGRYLQVLGADVEPEPVGSNGTRVDFRAIFPSGPVISVECVSKRFNQSAQQVIERQLKMASLLDAVGPTNWAIHLEQLPDAHSPDDFKPYSEQAEAFYRTLPEPSEGGPRFTFEWTGLHGPMELEAIPFPKGTMPNRFGPGIAYADDSILRLKDALIDTQKRRQARGADQPVFLAMDCPVGGPDAEDLDQALFGQTVDHRGLGGRVSVSTSFNANGLLVTDTGIPFAGVWAFLRLSLFGAAGPVLYLNPYQRWTLPDALAGHERRVWTSRIDKTPPTRESVINLIGFVRDPGTEFPSRP